MLSVVSSADQLKLWKEELQQELQMRRGLYRLIFHSLFPYFLVYISTAQSTLTNGLNCVLEEKKMLLRLATSTNLSQGTTRSLKRKQVWGIISVAIDLMVAYLLIYTKLSKLQNVNEPQEHIGRENLFCLCHQVIIITHPISQSVDVMWETITTEDGICSGSSKGKVSKALLPTLYLVVERSLQIDGTFQYKMNGQCLRCLLPFEFLLNWRSARSSGSDWYDLCHMLFILCWLSLTKIWLKMLRVPKETSGLYGKNGFHLRACN